MRSLKLHSMLLMGITLSSGYEPRQRGRFAGFSLYLSASTNRSNDSLCYKDGAALPPLNFTTTCTGYGRYAIFYNERLDGIDYPKGYERQSYTDLCEVIVKDDLSRKKTTYQILTNPCPTPNLCAGLSVAKNAVDRDPSTCTQTTNIGGTSPDTSVWWRVDLGDIYSIHSVRIQFKDYGEEYVKRQRGRFAGFSIFVSSSINKEHWVLCYKDGPELPPLDFNTTCMKHGRYVIYYNERLKDGIYPDGYETQSFTGLCEVIVHGCKKGVYGVNCDQHCLDNCLDHMCHIINGSCLGCRPGWTGDKCDKKCPVGKYGISCQHSCVGHCHNNAPCHHESGNCTDGCAVGWIGTLCNKECEDGTYGQGCIYKCSGNCLNSSYCNKTTGSCDVGCTPGYTGTLCNKTCPIRKFGILCRETCSGHCFNGTICNHVNGICIEGCESGYTGDRCDKSCEKGLFGLNCSQKCSINCRTANECINTDGSCVCSPGWKGSPHCNKKCDLGYYGENCHSNCGEYCINATCNRTDGTCLIGNIKDPIPSMVSTVESSSALTVGGVLGAFGVAIIVAMLTIIYLRLKRKISERAKRQRNVTEINASFIELRQKKTPNQSSTTEKSKDRNRYKSSDVEEIVKRGPPTNKTILTRNLQAIISKMSAAENGGFKHEYHEIRRGELFPCEEAKKPENKPKNRYTTTFPYDHSRVILKTSSPNESDYINANYIEDAQSNIKYIATQGPKPKTVVDFWRMTWQDCVNTIVCLTNLKEGTKIKCTQYWPNINDKVQHGNFIIRNLEEKLYANYTSRRLKVYNNMERKDREVVMFHYTRWPDHGVPDPLNLVVFHRHVMKTSPQPGKYTLVHCSAGIGRTGTYIALDALYREGERNGRVNVPMYVRTMRKDRMNMIQGEDQYRVLYLALCESFSGRSRCLTAEKLSQGGSCYSSCGEATNKTPLSSEFQSLQSLRIKYTEKDYEPGQTNISANYTESVLPVEKFMCYLSYAKGRNNYYNAVLLQSFTENDSLISAQYPLPDYTEDFLRLIRDFDARVVVFLGPLKEIKSSSLWVPKKSENKIVGSFVLNLATSTNSVNFTTRNIVLQPRGSSDIKITVLECKTWKEGRFLTDKRVLLDVVKEAKAEKDKEEGKILVLSSDGATRCGTFCVVYNALAQLSMDQEVDIFTIARQLQIRRPEFVSSLEEYQLCYDVFSEYMQNDSVYANC